MTKRGNTIIFIIAAAGFNILLTVMVFIILFLVFFVFIRPLVSDNGIVFALPFIFIAAVSISFTLYRVLLRRFLVNVDMDKYFDTAFSFDFRKKTPRQKPSAKP
ncbi:MAG: leader peptide processing enzyme [Spirochaetaceae bacterium]|jgi:hypothetical protein|nr:leader peptide processing enzyme [Spirochaetaceae bacterium]